MVGLGKMGANMTQRLIEKGHQVVAFDLSDEARKAVAAKGAETAATLAEMVAKLDPPRVAWVIVPAGAPTTSTIDTLKGLMERGDAVIDGGNSNYTEAAPTAASLAEKGIGFIDAGTSGGVWGLANGYCLMVGGEESVVAVCEPVFLALAPEGGYAHVGPVGAGHFVKMVHNGIEYGLMQAYAEGFDILKNANIEALPAEHRFDLDIADIAEVWRRGSVIPSWLLDLAASALAKNPTLETYSGFVEDSGEGRWTVNAAIDEAVPAEVLTAALFARFRSRQDHTFAEKILSAMREGFGGHKEPPHDAAASTRKA